MDISTAKEILGPDRILIISMIEFLINKGIVHDYEELETFRDICNKNLLEFKKQTDDPVVNIQISQTQLIVTHIFNSFGLR